MREDRVKIYEQYDGPKNGSMRRMFLDYNRYFEADLIHVSLNDIFEAIGTKWDQMTVLDYGCGVADYGIYFARLGSRVALIDKDQEALDFAVHRFVLEDIADHIVPVESKINLAIFGEVLDHLDNPAQVIQRCIDLGVEYIFTSSYPYRSDDYNDVHWQHDHHPKAAFDQQKACRVMLELTFDKYNMGGERNLWIRKQAVKL